MVLAEYLDNKK
nr:NAD(P)H-quinone oxidoreductase subunit K [Pabstiella mirabilis]